MPSIAEAVQALQPVDAESANYLDYHRRRYRYLMEAVARVSPTRILDVGMSYQTLLLRKLYPSAELETIGYFDYRFPRTPEVRHTEFDLNLAADEAAWPECGSFDVIVMAEVIEHLHVAPTHVLRMFRKMLRPGGAIVLQTPNTINLARRITLLFGQSPFRVIRDDPKNPGHFCEYTVEQLREVAARCQMSAGEWSLSNYFGSGRGWQRIYNGLCAILPGQLHEGITIILRVL